VNNNPLIYFDNAATTQKPRQVIEAIKDFYENHNANVHRAVHTLSHEATDLHENAREKIARFINAKDAAEIVFVRGTTEAVNLLAYAWGLHNLKKGDEVIVSLMEHHSNIVPWEIISKINGFGVKYAKINDDGTIDYKDFESKISSKTKLASFSHVSNVSGIINDIKKITQVVHENGALMFVDGAQSVPHMPVDVRDLDVDFLAFSGHKMLGPTGIGALYGKKHLLETMEPFQGGGEMIKEVSFNKKKYLESIGMFEVLKYEKMLTEYAVKTMQNCCTKLVLYGSSDHSRKCGIIPFGITGLSSHDVALFLDNYGIMIRSGFHCAQPLHQVFKLQSSARASFYIYNTREEIARFIEVLKEIEQF